MLLAFYRYSLTCIENTRVRFYAKSLIITVFFFNQLHKKYEVHIYNGGTKPNYLKHYTVQTEHIESE